MKKRQKWGRGFRCAWEGWRYAVKTQKHMKFHAVAAAAAIALSFSLQIPKFDWLFVLAAIALVFTAELINTAIEKTVDLAMPDVHPLAKIAKDAAAAAVLVAAVFAVVAAIVVFYNPLVRLLF